MRMSCIIPPCYDLAVLITLLVFSIIYSSLITSQVNCMYECDHTIYIYEYNAVNMSSTSLQLVIRYIVLQSFISKVHWLLMMIVSYIVISIGIIGYMPYNYTPTSAMTWILLIIAMLIRIGQLVWM